MNETNPWSLKQLVGSLPRAKSGSRGVDIILQAVRTHLGMDVAFLSEFRVDDRLFRNVDAKGKTPLQVGDTALLENGYCQRVVDGRLPQIINNAQNLPAAAALPETSAIPIGAHLSVPVYLKSGRIYGTFCCFSFSPDESLGERDLQVMRAFADLLVEQIEVELLEKHDGVERIQQINEFVRQGQPISVYQPIFQLQKQQIVGMEGLSRFNTVPMRSPDLWFADAAAVGLGPALEARAARTALAALSVVPHQQYIAVNASPEFILSGELREVLANFDMSRIVLEITEHAAVTDYDELQEVLNPLRMLGLRVSIDDTGAGYASMRHILQVEPDLIKLDISITRGIDQDRKRRALASALIAFARETEVDIIAEGIETADELATLRTLGVSHGQGYYLARPLPLADIPPNMPAHTLQTDFLHQKFAG